MARLGRQKALVAASTPPMATSHPSPPAGLVASAIRLSMDGQGWRQYRFGDTGWQEELWRLYDIVGEFRFIANWIGSALSRVRFYVADVDKNGRIQQETKDPKIAALADNLYGSPAAKQEAMRLLGINLTVAGDAFAWGKGAANGEADEWTILSCSELKRYGNSLYYLYPDGGREKIDLSNSIVYRIWTPHPRRTMQADSPARAAMPILLEIERLTRFVFAQIDSRLASAGLLAIPQDMSFPDDDDEDVQLTGAQSLTKRLVESGSQSLKGEGTAAGVMPTVLEVPADALGKLQLIQFTSELSQQARELRGEAIRRFGLAMDIDPAILMGASEANHWGAWQITEGQIKVHIEPLVSRVCDANNKAVLAPALKAMGKDPARYCYAGDTAPLTVRPQRLKDTMDMYEKGHVSRETVIISGDYRLSDIPSAEEDLQRFTRELMLRDPNLFQVPAIRKVAGYTDEILPPGEVVIPQKGGPGGAGPPPPPAPPTGILNHELPPVPEASTAQNALGGPPATPSPGIVASATVPSPVTMFVVANAAVLRAMEVAGKRLLTGNARGTLLDVPAHELHTRLPVADVNHARKILTGALDHFGTLTEHMGLAIDADSLKNALHLYCLGLLVRGEPHTMNNLGETLIVQGYLNGYP